MKRINWFWWLWVAALLATMAGCSSSGGKGPGTSNILNAFLGDATQPDPVASPHSYEAVVDDRISVLAAAPLSSSSVTATFTGPAEIVPGNTLNMITGPPWPNGATFGLSLIILPSAIPSGSTQATYTIVVRAVADGRTLTSPTITLVVKEGGPPPPP